MSSAIVTLSNLLQAMKDLRNSNNDVSTTMSQLQSEINNYMHKRSQHQNLDSTFEYSPSTMRQRVFYKGIQVKYNIIEATLKIFMEKRQKTDTKMENLLISIQPLLSEDHSNLKDLSVEILNGKLQEYKTGVSSVEGIHTEYKKLLEEWNEMKEELFAVIDDNIRRLQEMVGEHQGHGDEALTG